MSVLEDEADILRHIIHVRNLRPEVLPQDSLENHHGESVGYVGGSKPGGVDGSLEETHVIRESYAEEGSDGEGGGAAGVAEGAGVEADGVDEDERQLEAVDDAHCAFRVRAVQDDEIVTPS